MRAVAMENPYGSVLLLMASNGNEKPLGLIDQVALLRSGSRHE